MDDLPHPGGFFQDDKILRAFKLLSFYLTSPLLACVLCVQGHDNPHVPLVIPSCHLAPTLLSPNLTQYYQRCEK